MVRFVNQFVGRLISIKEQENKEWQGIEEFAEEFFILRILQQKFNDVSVIVLSKIFILFELKLKVKKLGLDVVKSQYFVEAIYLFCFVYFVNLFSICDIEYLGLSVVFYYLDMEILFEIVILASLSFCCRVFGVRNFFADFFVFCYFLFFCFLMLIGRFIDWFINRVIFCVFCLVL